MTKPHGDNPCGLNFTVIFRGNAVKRDSRRLYRQYHKTIRLMKKLFRLFLCLALFSGTAACSDDEASQNLIVINGGEHFLSLDGLARAGKISVLAPAPWRVTKAAGDTWFTLSATEGPAGGRTEPRRESGCRTQRPARLCMRGCDRTLPPVAGSPVGRL